MNKGSRLFILLLSCVLSYQVSAQNEASSFRVITFNIRYDNPGDSFYSWKERKEMVLGVIRTEDPAVIGLQEVLANQLSDLKEAFPQYGSAGVGRDDGMTKGEFSPVLYKTSRFTLEKSSTFWLSETPSVPGSISWNSACTRIVTWARLRDKQTGNILYFFNTHLDHVSEEARVNSAALLLDSIRAIAGSDPVILTGDFNCTSSEKAYKTIATELYDCRQFNGAQETAFQTTFIGFPADLKKREVIDHIFLGRGDHFTFRSYNVLLFNLDGKFPSDHLPVETELIFSQSALVGKVNPFIGTGGHGHTYPGASVPFGMVQLSPDTRLEGWDGCSAYHASDTVIYGFSHTHLSGTGCSDYGDVLLMPAGRPVSTINYNYASGFDPASETAQPGYYAINLPTNKVKAELTVTPRTGIHRYTFLSSEQQNIVLDLKHRDKVLGSGFRVISKNEIEGFRISQAWAQKQMVYFVIRFSKPFEAFTMETGDELQSEITEYSGENIKVVFNFSPSSGEELLVKVGISGVSTEGARLNLDNELPDWDFDRVRTDAREAWESELGKIRVEGGTRDEQTTFYTALYHVMLSPNLYMDVDGQYRGRDLEIHKSDGFRNYTVFSLWDTYRAAHPLFTIIDRRRTADFINTFIRQYEEGGMLPVWELSGNETNCMIGYHAVPVIVDAWIKGVRGFDEAKAMEAMKNSAMQDRFGLKYYRTMGYIPGDKEGESVSKTLEYAYDDWCIAQMAKGLNLQEDYNTYIKRAQYYKNVYDPSTGFMRAKQNSTWFSPFDPYEVNFNYTEANSWQYSFYVPQDIDGLMKLMGGKEKLAIKLDDLFAAKMETSGRDQADITGLIGQYAHGNEPSHHMAYLYDYVGQPWKTQALVHRICNEFYRNDRDGLIGNEDCGQMSAWYVFSTLGFYPVTPGSDIYAIGTPLFPKASIRLESGRTFSVVANGISDSSYYIQSATLNGAPFEKSFITDKEILAGGELAFQMSSVPNKNWGSAYPNYPASSIRDLAITPVPAFSMGDATFLDSTIITLNCADPKAVIRYTIDGTDPGTRSKVYSKPLPASKTTTIKAVAISKETGNSFMIEAIFTKIPKNRKITIAHPYAPQYSAGGDLALINFIRGGENFRTGAWQGYEGVDLDATIDIGVVQKISKVSAGFLQDHNSWIFYPEEIEVFVSTDGKEFRSVAASAPEAPIKDPEVRVLCHTAEFGPVEARFVRLVAKNPGICPPWHVGSGSKAWIFCDEININ